MPSLSPLIVVALVFAAMAAIAPTPRLLRPSWCLGAFALSAAGYLTAAHGVALGNGVGAAMAIAGAIAIAVAFWLLRPGPEIQRIPKPRVDWDAFERAAYEEYLRSDVRA